MFDTELKINARQPFRLILLCLFSAIVLSASLLMLLQYFIGSIGLRYAKDYYSYVGTVIDLNSDTPDVDTVPVEAVELLRSSGDLEEQELRSTFSGRAPALNAIPDFFINMNLSNWYIFTGEVSGEISVEDRPLYRTEVSPISVDKIYAGYPDLSLCDGELVLQVLSSKLSEEAVLARGARYLIIGTYGHDRVSRALPFQVTAYSDPPWEIFPQSVGYDETLLNDCVIGISEGSSQAEADGFVRQYLEERGLSQYIRRINETENIFTVRRIGDMSMIFPVINENMFYTVGRGIGPGDAGTKVCVISDELAAHNGLNIGDFISLELSDGCYLSGDNLGGGAAGIESGVPFTTSDTELSYGNSEEYEIVGLFAFAERKIAGDYYSFSYNDVFIPTVSGERASVQGAVRPYLFSFRVNCTDFDDFIAATEHPLMQAGFGLRLSNSKWPLVRDLYTKTESRQALNISAAVSFFCLVVFACSFLTLLLYRKELALRVMLGADKNEIRRGVSVPFFLSSLFSFAVSVGIVSVSYFSTLRQEALRVAPTYVPEDGLLVLMLAAVALIALLLAYSFLRILLSAQFRQKNVLWLIQKQEE